MANQTGLQFTVTVGELPESTFAVAEFTLHEALNTPFELNLELASLQPDIDFAAVLEQPCELLVWFDGEIQRRISGVVSQFAQGDTGFRRTRYSLQVKPALWRLSLRHNARIFRLRHRKKSSASYCKKLGSLIMPLPSKMNMPSENTAYSTEKPI